MPLFLLSLLDLNEKDVHTTNNFLLTSFRLDFPNSEQYQRVVGKTVKAITGQGNICCSSLWAENLHVIFSCLSCLGSWIRFFSHRLCLTCLRKTLVLVVLPKAAALQPRRPRIFDRFVFLLLFFQKEEEEIFVADYQVARTGKIGQPALPISAEKMQGSSSGTWMSLEGIADMKNPALYK